MFLVSYGKKYSGAHLKEHQEALQEYRKIVDDYTFQEKLQKLALLEQVICQSINMDDIKIKIHSNKTAKNPCLYVTCPFYDSKLKMGYVKLSMGPRKNFVKSINQLYEDPEFMSQARAKLLDLMKEKYIYDVLKLRFTL
jgi:hypothetical protein